MKKIFNFLKMVFIGTIPAVSGGLITTSIVLIVRNVQAISVASGWTVVLHFVYAALEAILAVLMLYELGDMYTKYKNWMMYKAEVAGNTTNDSSDAEAVDTSSETKSKSTKGRRKKS